MPQPTFATSGGLAIVKFGNQPLPNGQGTLSYINLNDRLNWFCQAPVMSYDNRQLTLAQRVYRGRSDYLADDWGPWKFSVPFFYTEGTEFGGSSTPLGQVLAQLITAGEQLLTFDNSTALPVKVSKVNNRKWDPLYTPPLWSFDLELLAKGGWWQDISSTSIGSQALNSGTGTNFTVTYGGSIWTDILTWTLTIPGSNAAPIQSFSLANTMSGETLSMTFPGNLAASTAWTLTIDCTAWTVVDQHGTAYDISGSFPLLYQPAGQSNAFTATLTPASGTATSCTLSGSYTNRWLL